MFSIVACGRVEKKHKSGTEVVWKALGTLPCTLDKHEAKSLCKDLTSLLGNTGQNITGFTFHPVEVDGDNNFDNEDMETDYEDDTTCCDSD